MTRVVELVVNAAGKGIAEQELQAALSKLYSKPPEHFDKLIHQIFTVQQPYTLLKDIDEQVANKHKARLEKIGLDCSIEMSLSLVPVGGEASIDGSAPETPKCPVCDEPTTSQEACSSCGVDLRKSTSARHSADAIQRTLESAEQELKNKKQQQQNNLVKKRKEKKEKVEKAQAEAESQPAEKPPVKDVFTAEYADADDERKRKLKFAGAAAVVAAGVLVFGAGALTISPPDNPDATAIATADAAGDTAQGALPSADQASVAASSATTTQNVIAAATAAVEAGTPNAAAADDFDEVIAKFERKAEMQADNRSAEEVAQDLTANSHRNTAEFQQDTGRTDGAGGKKNPAGAGQQLKHAGASSHGAVPASSAGASSLASTASTYQDQFLSHWASRQTKVATMTDLVTKLLKQGKFDLAQQLVDETDDTWLAIHAQHKIAIAEQMSGDAEGSYARMMNLFVDLMTVSDLPEKIAALADHAQTWHLMLGSTQTDNAFNQMRSMAAAPMSPRQTIIANVAMASSLKTTGRTREARKHFDEAITASLKVNTQNSARDEMIHFIAVAEASSRLGDDALIHAAKIRDQNVRQAAYQSLYQTFSRYGMDREASAALQKSGGANMPKIKRAKLESKLKHSPKLSELDQ